MSQQQHIGFLLYKKDRDLSVFLEQNITCRVTGTTTKTPININVKLIPVTSSTDSNFMCVIKYLPHTNEIYRLNIVKIFSRDKYARLYDIFSRLMDYCSLSMINFEDISKSTNCENLLRERLKQLETVFLSRPQMLSYYINTIENVIKITALYCSGDLIESTISYETTGEFKSTIVNILYQSLLRLLKC